jgi:hypothetical protein
MSNFPQNFDDDTTLPVVNDNLTEIGGEAINALRDAVVNIEMNIGLGVAGTTPSIAARLGLVINPDGTLNSSTLTSLGLVTVPIYNVQIAEAAGIAESKLQLNYPTSDLFNYIRDLSREVNTALGWISISGSKLEPHLIGSIYRHDLAQIDVSENPSQYFLNKFDVQRDNTDSYTAINDINNELLFHQWADGSPFGTLQNVVTHDSSTYPSYYAHTASGIFVDTSRFQTIPQNDQDVQSIFEFLDDSSQLLLGARLEDLYSNGISVNSRSSSLTIDGYGQNVVPTTPAISYLLYPNGNSSTPVDNINFGDDMIQFMPTSDGYVFDEQFAQVQPGNIIRINYGDGYNIEVAFVIREVKYVPGTLGNSSSFYVRIAGKNLYYSTGAVARIDKQLFNNNKYGVLAVAAANNPASGSASSLIVASPRGAQTLGIGFSPDQFDNTHYLLYLALYPDGVPTDGYTVLPAIDVTGNQGTTPGAYTLDSIVTATNNAFRQVGYNYRFVAFEYQGNFGIMLADSYNNASFSIINMLVTPGGMYDTVNTPIAFPNNVVGNIANPVPDPLGFGPLGSNIGSPPLLSTYGSSAASQYPTQVLCPLSNNNYYVNGTEEQRLNIQVGQILDSYGDGYWVATIDGYTAISGPSGHVIVTYNVPLDLSTSDLKIGKTLVVQSLGTGTLTNFGRFIISNINFEECPIVSTQITVYDAVHAVGISPAPILAVGSQVALYFNSDSVAFNAENATDVVAAPVPFRRHFEVYVDDAANTYTQERARFNTNGSSATVMINSVPLYSSAALAYIDIVSISPKLTGYYSGITKINLQIFGYDLSTGGYDGYLCNFNGSNATNLGPITLGQQGLVTRFYDESNIDYIDILFAYNGDVPAITSPTNMDIQLFPSLALDQEIMLLGTCEFNDTTGQVTYTEDRRQFGNISEQQFTTSAIEFIQAPVRELQENGIIRGFDYISQNNNTIFFTGGEALVNGKIVLINPQTITIPIVLESLPTVIGGSPSSASTVNAITWFICVNDQEEIILIASTDFDPLGSFASQYLSVGLDHNRIFSVLNPNTVSPAPYQIRGTFLSNLVLTQKDVTPIATVFSIVTNTGTGFTVNYILYADARRYVTNGYGGLVEPLTLGALSSFRSIESVLNWLIQFNNFISSSSSEGNAISNKVIVKGHVSINTTAVIMGTPGLGFVNNEVYFEGDNGNFDIYCPTGFELGSNIHFNNITFNYYYDPTVVFYSPAYTILTGTFTMSAGSTVLTSKSQADILTPGRTISFSLQSGIIYIIASVSPTQITLTTNYAGSTGSSLGYAGNYNTTDLINDGFGAIHIGVFSIYRNISITNCHFIWYPSVAGVIPLDTSSSSTGINRHSFINVDLDQPSITIASILQDAIISNNTFYDNILPGFVAAALETTRAAISFVSTSTISTANLYGAGMKLIDVVVRDNVCDKDQMIALVPSYSITPGTIANSIDVTNVLIENNTCGVISVFTQYNVPFDINETLTFNFLNYTLDKNNGLVVRNNTCKYITSSDSTGHDLAFSATACLTNTGPLIISDNTVSWIRLPLNGGAAFTVIKNNILNAYDTNFIAKFTSTATFNNAAIDISYIGTPDSVNSVIIDGNQIDAGIYSTISPLFTIYYYDIGINVSYHDANIGNNWIQTLSKILQVGNPIGVQINPLSGVSVHSNIHHNKFIREFSPVPWKTYIVCGPNNIVSDNFFDQTSPDGTSLFNGISKNQVLGSTTASIVHNNINQGYNLPITLLDGSVYYSPIGVAAASATGPASGSSIEHSDIVTAFLAPGNVQISKFSPATLFGASTQYTVVGEFVTPAPNTQIDGYRNVSFVVPLSTYLPVGAKILQLQVGVWLQYEGAASLDITSAANNAVTLTINQSTDSQFTTSVALITDVAKNVFPTPPLVGVTGTDYSVQGFPNPNSYYTMLLSSVGSSGSNYIIVTPTQAQTATTFLTLGPFPTGTWTTSNNNRIFAQLDLNFLRTGGTTVTDEIAFYFSPLLVTYTW